MIAISWTSTLRNCLCPRLNPPTIHQVSGPTLTTMPREILDMVCDYLSPSDTASLVLSNRHMLCMLGTNHLTTLSGRGREQDRERFLSTLTRDLPKQFYCHYCFHLHPRAALELPGLSLPSQYRLRSIKNQEGMCGQHRLRWIEDQESMCPDRAFQTAALFTFYRLTFSHLQLAMQRYHLGPGYGISLESFAYKEVQRDWPDLPKPLNSSMTTLLSIEARICPRPLGFYLRVQSWTLFHTIKCDGLLHICDHLRPYPYDQLLQSRLKRDNAGSQIENSTCHICNTDFQIEIMEVDNEGPAIVLTKWIDLGAGLTPMDPKWKVHFFDPE